MAKRLQISEIMEEYFRLRLEEEKIVKIKDAIKNNNNQSINLQIDINGEAFELSSLNNNYNELNNFINRLLFVNSQYKEEVVGKIRLKDDTVNKETLSAIREETKEVLKSEEDMKPQEDTLKLEHRITKIIDQLDRGEVVVAGEILEYLNRELNLNVELSDINQILSAKLKKEELNSIYFVKCYKCDSKYEAYLEKLPRIITCPDCKEEILNVELRFNSLNIRILPPLRW